MKKYFYYFPGPGETLNEIEAESKADAKKKIEERLNTKLKFGEVHKPYYLELVSVQDYRHYNFSKFSYLVKCN